LNNILKITDLQPDAHNANRGTKRGHDAVTSSLKHCGAGRSILIDKHGKIIAGNKTAASAAQAGIDDVLVVPTDGTQIIAVQRTDLDLDTDAKARELAIADNRTAELGLEWDADALAELSADLNLQPYFSDTQLSELTGHVATFDAPPQLPSGDKQPFQQMAFVLHDEQVETVKAAIAKSKKIGEFVDSPNENVNGNALARICELFLGNAYGNS
jgi:hypothetical protein